MDNDLNENELRAKAIRELITNELSLKVDTASYSSRVDIQLVLGDEPIGDPVFLDIRTESSHEHSTDHIDSVTIEAS